MNAILDIALALALVYLLFCMLVSGLQEILARSLGSRGRFLREGLLNLLTDRWIYLRTINHPSIVALYRHASGKRHAPSYLPTDVIAQALFDILVCRHQKSLAHGQVVFSLAAVQAAVRHAKEIDSSLGQALLPIVEAATSLEQAVDNVARWCEQSLQRVSGWYKAHTQKQLFAVGLIVAAVLNIDSIAIVETLARDPALRAGMVAAARQASRYQAEVDSLRPAPQAPVPEPEAQSQAAAQQRLQEAKMQLTELSSQGLPIGYACLGAQSQTTCRPFSTVHSWPLKIAGLLLTALAAALGAPFWFDLIGRVVNLRGSGSKPVKAV